HGQGPRRRSGASGTPTARSRIDSKTFKRSNDPGFIGKLEDVAGLYMNPPGHALVFRVGDPSMNAGRGEPDFSA
ncbi:MAG: hypothetical protein WBF22_05685, partial [Methylocella sp.]